MIRSRDIRTVLLRPYRGAEYLGETAPAASSLKTHCEQLAADRQRQLQTRSFPTHSDSHDFVAYLYQTTDWTYPILAAVARLSDDFQTPQ